MGGRRLIYFIQDEGVNHIKIGFTEQTLPARMGQLDTGCPSRMVMLCTIEGDRKKEDELHERFKDAWVKGEWFRPVPALVQFIAENYVASQATQPVESLSEIERNAVCAIIGQLRLHGPEAFSLRTNPSRADGVSNLAFWVHQAKGIEGMRRVYDAVEEQVCKEWPDDSEHIMYILDHRFDGIGEWYA